METTFNCMNSTVKLKGLNQSLQEKVIHLFTRFESKASRFIPGNDLDFVNNRPKDVPIFLEETLADLLEKSSQLSRKVDYYVNPFLGDVMKSIGYIDSFSPEFSSLFKTKESLSPSGYVKEPYEKLEKQWIIKNKEFYFDFGGFGKGYIVDRAKDLLLKEGVNEAIVNAGGDLTVIGTHQVGIEHPTNTGKDMMRLYITNSSMATSAKNYRTWTDGKQMYHHIVNGQTGEVATNDVLQATAIAKTTMVAETITKLFCILPFDQVKYIIKKNFPSTAYVVYLNNNKVIVGGDNTMYERLEVSP